MEPNNAESNEVTEVIETNQAEAETTDIFSTPKAQAIDEVEPSTGDESGVEEPETTKEESDLVYDFDGEEVSASTLKEWKENGLRQSDYTKKSQANAETRKALESKGAELDSLKESLSERIAQLEESIKLGAEDEDLDYLREHNTGEYLKRKEQLADKDKAAKQAKADLQEMQSKADQERLLNEQKLLNDALPTWQDAKQKEADIQLIESYVKDSGLSDESFNKLQDHKLMLMALDAARFNALNKETEEISKQVETVPNIVKARVKQKVVNKPKSDADLFYG